MFSFNVTNHLRNIVWPNSPLQAPSPPANDLINRLLGADHFQGIFDQLKYYDLSQCSRICRKWRVLVNQYLINRLVLDAERARILTNELGPTIPIPENLRTFLEQDSPFWIGKKNYHARPLIAFIPPTTLNEFLTWAETKGLSLRYMDKSILEKHGNTLIRSRWVAMTPVVPGSHSQPYEKGKELATQPDKGFQAAKLAEATVCIAIQVLLGREHTYGQKPWTFARCEELHSDCFHVIVGGAAPPSAASLGGPYVYVDHHYGDVDDGVAALAEV